MTTEQLNAMFEILHRINTLQNSPSIIKSCYTPIPLRQDIVDCIDLEWITAIPTSKTSAKLCFTDDGLRVYKSLSDVLSYADIKAT